MIPQPAVKNLLGIPSALFFAQVQYLGHYDANGGGGGGAEEEGGGMGKGIFRGVHPGSPPQ